jgi:hypothetical protein
MRVADVQVAPHADGCELRARVEPETELAPYDGKPLAPFDLWYRFPAWCRDFLRPDNGDPFLAALLVPAMTLGEPLEVPAPVSPALLRALPEIKAILHCCDRRQSPFAVAATAREHPPPPTTTGPHRGLFFSLGIDSFYSLFKNMRDHPDDEGTVTHLIAVHGMDVWDHPWDERFPPELLANSRRVAAETGKALLPVATNVRAALDRLCLWPMAHGGGLASIALALGGLFGSVRIAAATTYDQLYPWGSHPVLDPLWSAETVRVVHDGCERDRIAKTALVASSQLALDTLRVCPGFTAEYNCGRCLKCLPTMIDLLHLGVLDRCRTLPHTIDAEQLRRVLVAYRGGLNVDGYRQRLAAFADGEHDDVRAVLAAYLAAEDGEPGSDGQLLAPAAGGWPQRAARWLPRLRYVRR